MNTVSALACISQRLFDVGSAKLEEARWSRDRV